MLHSIPGSRGKGSGLPGYCQINKVIITQVLQIGLDACLWEKQTTLYIQDMLPTQEAPRQLR